MSEPGDSGLRDRVTKIEYDLRHTPTMETMRSVQDEMRSYVDQRNKVQTEDVIRLIGTQNAGNRSDIMAEVKGMIRDSLDEWAKDKLEPAVNTFLEAKQAAEEKAKRDAEEKEELRKQSKLRTRQLQIAIAAGVVALLYALFDPFTPRQHPQGPLDMQRRLTIP